MGERELSRCRLEPFLPLMRTAAASGGPAATAAHAAAASFSSTVCASARSCASAAPPSCAGLRTRETLEREP